MESRKFFIMVGMTVGMLLGGYIPTLWGDNGFSMTSLFASSIGGLLGIWIAFRATE